ncbi:hypothetical protein N657DRAFT_477266 [Parathielavia appendiculata]|uniref:Uncharacterized protein n=1 Tax=Parathielavia appendiculata TaxID=2587402 RepID=A0AAN6TZS6_9PEZI|nr:hypothetical protein N657DRAFT_477266 [Parathielavia appendiculata]
MEGTRETSGACPNFWVPHMAQLCFKAQSRVCMDASMQAAGRVPACSPRCGFLHIFRRNDGQGKLRSTDTGRHGRNKNGKQRCMSPSHPLFASIICMPVCLGFPAFISRFYLVLFLFCLLCTQHGGADMLDELRLGSRASASITHNSQSQT